MKRSLRWLGKMRFTLGARVFAGFGVVLGIFAAQALLTNLGLQDAVDNFNRFGQLDGENLAIQQIERDALDLQRSVLAFSYTGYEGMLPRIRRLRTALAQQSAQVQANIQDAPRLDLLQRMASHLELYGSNFETAVEDRRLRDQLLEQKFSQRGKTLSRELAGIAEQLRHQKDHASADIAADALQNLLEMRLNARDFFMTPDSSLIRAANEHMDRFASLIASLQQRLGNPDSRARLKKIARQAEDYELAFLAVAQATRGYLHMVNVVLAGEAAEIARLTAELQQLTLAQQAQVIAHMEAQTSASQRSSHLISLFAIAAGLLAAWGITRSLSRPITAMTHALTALALGHKNIQIPGRGRNDEIGAMAIAADIFKSKADELDNASRYKSEFLANMSHELRTPLNSLLILAKILAANEQGNLSPEQVESAQIIYSSGKDLLALINDVLDLSKVEAGCMEVISESRRLADFAADIEAQFRHAASQKGLLFRVGLDDGLPEAACSDWNKVEQIARNLLSNAFKFTEQGCVQVRIGRPVGDATLRDAGLDGGEVLALAVSDTGIGIPAAMHEQVFEAFRQVDGTLQRKYGGTGLGLSISRRFAHLLGGELQLASQAGQGSTFTLYFPASSPQDKPAGGDSERQANRRHPDAERFFREQPVVALLVDDEPLNLLVVGRVLQDKVHTLYSAKDGREALAQLAQHPEIDIVLLDMMMPGMDGYQTTRAIRAQPCFYHLPVIALTASAMRGDREACLEAGTNDYLAKPVDTQELLDAAAFWVAHSRAQAVRAAATAEPPQADAALPAPPAEPAPPVGWRKAGRPTTLLIADSDMRTTFSLAHALQPYNGAVHMAGSSQKVLELLEQTGIIISIILLGTRLDKQDAYPLLQEIRRRTAAEPPLVIALADEAEASAGERLLWLDGGAQAYLIKPLAVATLQQAIANALDQATPTEVLHD